MKNSTVLACAVACGLGFVGAKVLDQQVYAQLDNRDKVVSVAICPILSPIPNQMQQYDLVRIWGSGRTEYSQFTRVVIERRELGRLDDYAITQDSRWVELEPPKPKK